MGIFKGFITMLQTEFSGYGAKKLLKDLLAGVTVAAVALPLALAFGVSSGASAAAGMITAVVAGLFIGALSGGSYQISGPTGAMTAILLTLVAQYQLQGVFIACLISGVLLILAGVFKLGELVSFIPLPVITGFTSGIAVVIAIGQIDNLTGLSSESAGILTKLAGYFQPGQSVNPSALLIGLGVVAFMFLYPHKLNQYFPGSLAAIILATLSSVLFRLPVETVGQIPRTLFLENRLDVAAITLDKVTGLFMPAFSIAALGLIESLLCGACAGRMKGEKLNARQELIAQGVGNMILPFFGGVPATAAIARTSVAIKAGGHTRLTSIFHALFLLLSMFMLGGVMSKIPLPALAGVLMVTAWKMNEWHTIRYIFRKRIKTAVFQFSITMASTVVFDLTVAILIGVLFSLVMFVIKISDMQIFVSDVDPEKLPDSSPLSEKHRRTGVVYITGPLYFATASRLENKLEELADKETLIFSMRGVPFADVSGVKALEELSLRLSEKNVSVYFTCVQPVVMEMFNRCGMKDSVGEEQFYWSTDKVLDAIAQSGD